MTIFQAIILGIIQGITEFFPVSSSGHLVIFQALFGMKEPLLTFDIVLHFGTLVSITIFFHKDILDLFNRVGCLQQPTRLFRSTLFYLAIASIPTFIIALLFKDTVEKFFGMPRQVGFMLLLTGAWLIFVTFRSKKNMREKSPGVVNSVLIGVAQGIAIMPGISRSGATIGAGLLAGLKREVAFKFSFLLAIPAILGATLLESREIVAGLTSGDYLYFLSGAFTAMAVGLVSIGVLSRIIRSGRLYIFGIYCILAASSIMVLL